MILAQAVRDLSNCDQPAMIGPGRSTSWAQWAEWVLGLRERVAPWAGERVGLAVEATAESFALLAALSMAGCDTSLFDGTSGGSGTGRLGDCHGVAAIFRTIAEGPAGGIPEFQALSTGPREGEAATGQGRIILFTSGSTGKPKTVVHTWESLMRPARHQAGPADDRPLRWLWAFRPYLYAGLQVFVQCLVSRGALLVPPSGAMPGIVARWLREQNVNYVSSTPSYWRWLLSMAGSRAFDGVELTQITLGGEIADQDVLDRLRESFPSARLVHIYATSELGRCFSVKDGRAGFPADYLDRPTRDGVGLRIENGELLVRSPHAAPGFDDWSPTGDLVEQVGGRVLFRGRKSDLINVGGNKVSPLAVEREIREVSGVQDVRVFARRSSLAGQLVACELVVDPECDPEQVRREVQRHCADRLEPHQRPRFLAIVASIALSRADKRVRNQDAGPDRSDTDPGNVFSEKRAESHPSEPATTTGDRFDHD